LRPDGDRLAPFYWRATIVLQYDTCAIDINSFF
jgi:hypothetical protein